jgi:hypothetical protein
LGKCVVEMMEGRLEPQKAERWAWSAKPNDLGGACESYVPTRDIKDMKREFASQVQVGDLNSTSPVMSYQTTLSTTKRQKLSGNL